jgi:hypothetical protein
MAKQARKKAKAAHVQREWRVLWDYDTPKRHLGYMVCRTREEAREHVRYAVRGCPASKGKAVRVEVKVLPTSPAARYHTAL